MKPLPLLLLLVLGVVGCGGETVQKTSTVTGTVLDADNQPVRGATVSSRFGSAQTSTTGAYVLTRQGDGEVELVAEVRRNGVLYRGRTSVLNAVNETTASANIVVAPESELATLSGVVRDRQGFTLQRASVFAYFGAGSSQRTFTDERGRYTLRDLVAGVDYALSAGGAGLSADQTVVRLRAGERRSLDFTVDDGGLPFLQPPTGLSVVTWVSPNAGSRRPDGDPYEAVKRLMDPRRSVRDGRRDGTRQPTDPWLVEANLQWNEQRFEDLLGWGVYRAAGTDGVLNGIDFLPEPLAAYYVDLSLRPSSTYSYAVSTIGTLYPDLPNQTESRLSDRVVARTLNPLLPVEGPFDGAFRWEPGSGAGEFIVFLFDEFPGVGVQALWSNSARATGTSVVYDGPLLTRGRTYYWLVVGLANSDESRTISRVATLLP